MSLTSIDDLLQHEDEHAPRSERGAGVASWMAKSAAGAAVLAALAVLVLRIIGIALPFALLFAAAFALLALRRLLREVRPAPTPRARRRAHRDESDYVFNTGDALRSALSRWESRLEWVRDDAPRFTRTVREQIAEIADERLRQRHGVIRSADPARARELLGDRLWRLLNEPVVHPPSPRELAELVADVERV